MNQGRCYVAKRFLLFTIILAIVFTTTGCEIPPKKNLTWNDVSNGVHAVLKNWYNNICFDDQGEDQFRLATGAIALRWGQSEFVKGVDQYILQELTTTAAQKAVESLFPTSWGIGLIRDQLVAWILKSAVDGAAGEMNFHSAYLPLSIPQINKRSIGAENEWCTAIGGDLPSDLIFTDFILVGYNQEARMVSILVISEHNGSRSLFGGVKQRAWAAEFEVDWNGFPIKSGQSLEEINLEEVLQLIPELMGTMPAPTLTPTPIPTPTLTPTPTERIAFVSDRDGNDEILNDEIYVMNVDGSGQTNLTNNSASDRDSFVPPAWSPDGKKIAFTSFRDGNAEIYVMNVDGSGQINLTNNSSGDIHPAWSPDGRKIAFVSSRDGNDEIYVMNADGSQPLRLTNNGSIDFFPAWSPDGKKIAFESRRDDNMEIYVMNADGSEQINLTNNGYLNSHPAWSPDGKKIAFTCFRDGNDEIYVMNADGSGQTNLTNNSAYDNYFSPPAWSPDGTRLAFESWRDEPDPDHCLYPSNSCNTEIYVMNADGSGQTNLTNNSSGDSSPAWSPDGKKIAFASVRDGNSEIYVMNADGSGQTNLTNNPAQDGDPAWAPVP